VRQVGQLPRKILNVNVTGLCNSGSTQWC